ncbi:bifunctional non-homologous end joining protein LigD [Paenibacillus castaneae]|uniref:ATP-dependent DNA ligase n=1 Tax=Paenibacillus castaneae TaxID=474957 RepID=UPI000C9D0D22|nr:RNA ligase family protein [Paenibacillus castaneae]NIK75685.1 bifunctional non-homologous end joining protein LigD [Paenibacillus castaneae]
MELKPVYPFEPISTSIPPKGHNWVAQIKWDGVRVLLYFDGNEAKLFNRRMNERTIQYPEFLGLSSFCKADSVILDGEMIAFDQNKPSFHEIMKRDSLKQSQKIKQSSVQIPVTYMIFDVLFYNGDWVTDRPLQYRQALLQNIIIPQNNLQLLQNYDDGAALFELMKQYQMEGVIFKDLQSTYRMNGKDARWRKMKVMKDLIAVVGGVTFRHNIVNSLLLGIYTNEGDLIYIGHAGTGKLTQKDWASITEYIKEIQITDRPFINEPERSKDAIWVKPELTVKVEYLELTSSGVMRHPSIQAVVQLDRSGCTVDQLKGQ